jgi:hypothetical protein
VGDVVYRSEVRMERVKGPIRRAYLPAETEPVIFGAHGAVADHYKLPSRHVPRLWTTSSLRRPADSKAHLQARWRRVKSLRRTTG